MQILFQKSIVFFALMLTFFLTFAAAEENKDAALPSEITKPPIKIGMTGSMTGGAAVSGQTMRLGIQIYFDKINAAGGIQGQKLELIAMDDGYEPLRAAANLHKLIDQDQVLAILGNNGTPAAVVAVPIVNKSKILLFGARTGYALLRKTPPDRYVINLRASHFDEVNTLIKAIIASGIKPENIAFFSQNDAFGDSIYLGGMKALKEQGYANAERLPYGRYDRNTLDVAAALGRIIEQAKYPIKAFVLGGVYEPNAQFIKLAKTEYPNAMFLAVSGLINPHDLTKAENDQILVSQAVPDPATNLPAIVEYREDLKKYGGGAEPSFGSLEGYLAAKLFVMGLQKAVKEKKLTREGLIDVFNTMRDIDLGIGVSFTFSKDDHNGLTRVWISIFKDGKFIETKWPNEKIPIRK